MLSAVCVHCTGPLLTDPSTGTVFSHTNFSPTGRANPQPKAYRRMHGAAQAAHAIVFCIWYVYLIISKHAIGPGYFSFVLFHIVGVDRVLHLYRLSARSPCSALYSAAAAGDYRLCL